MENVIVLFGILLLGLVFSFLYVMNINVSKYLEEKNNLKRKEINASMYQHFLDFDSKSAQEQIDTLVQSNIEKYNLEYLMINGIDYLNEEECKKMISSLAKSMGNLSPYYSFLIRQLSNEESIEIYIYKLCKDKVTSFIIEFNAPE